MIQYDDFRQTIDRLCQGEVERFISTVPYAKHLTEPNGDGLNADYYIRHRIETVKRIRLTAKTDASALAILTGKNYQLARRWSAYAAEELKHDRMFVTDLRTHGIEESLIDGIEPFFSTQLLVGYLHFELDRIGPLAAVAYSVFVEWNSTRYSATVVENAARQFSEKHVKGSRHHIGIDTEEDHAADMVRLAYDLLSNSRDDEEFYRCLKNFAQLFREYFRELYEETILKHSAH